MKQLHAVRVGAPPKFEAIAGSEFTLDVDLVLLAMGFLGPVRNGMIEQLGVALDPRGNVATTDHHVIGRRHFCGGGYEAGSVVGRLGDCRGPQGCGGGRSLPGTEGGAIPTRASGTRLRTEGRNLLRSLGSFPVR